MLWSTFAVFVTLLFTTTTQNDADNFEYEMLKIHNIYRLLHDANQLILDKKMSLVAKNVATSLVREGTPAPDCRRYGMNVYRFSRSDEANKNVIEIVHAANRSWFNGGYTYDFSAEPSNTDSTNGFTQIVWKNTDQIGTAISRNGASAVVVVLYFPKGNQEGHMNDYNSCDAHLCKYEYTWNANTFDCSVFENKRPYNYAVLTFFNHDNCLVRTKYKSVIAQENV